MKTPRYIYLILIFSLALNVIAVFKYNTSQEEKIHAKRKKKITNKENQKYIFDIPWPSILYHDSIPSPYKNKIAKTTILNTLVEKFNYQSYLEIGQGPRHGNFYWINCSIKIGVDPDKRFNATYQMTSDKFFALNKHSFDLIFVDGLHRAYQVERDILNSLEVLNKDGTIVVHDCNPRTEAIQIVPRQKPGGWSGDVWKAWVKLRATRSDLKMYVIDVNTGCGIIRKGKQETINIPGELTYMVLDENRKEFLNLVDINYFLKDLKK